MTWAAELLTLLTQWKQHWTKPTLRFKILQTKLAIDQSGRTSSTNRESIHRFASPSIMICNHCSWIANWAAHKIALASATIGGQGWWVLEQALDTVPLSSLATTARAEEDSATAASTLSFIHLRGGGGGLPSKYSRCSEGGLFWFQQSWKFKELEVYLLDGVWNVNLSLQKRNLISKMLDFIKNESHFRRA